jgi:hypothetical protein
MTQENNNNQPQQKEQKTPADNFIDTLNRLAPGEQREKFRSANFELMQQYPTVFQKLWSNDQNEAVEAVQWIKQKHNELAAQVTGVEMIK